VYAAGSIHDTAAFNQTRVGNPYLVPKSFDGWYAQAACHLWSSGSYALAPFVRFESFNTASAFEPLTPAGLTPEPDKAERIWTAGVNFNLNPHVVLKADVRRFQEDTAQNRVNLGLGWSF